MTEQSKTPSGACVRAGNPVRATHRPSPDVARELREQAVYGVPEQMAPGVLRVLADNAKDYTGPGTNTYVVGDERVWVIDPGPACERHLDAVREAVAERPVDGIFITHTHRDHSPAARPLQQAAGAPVYCAGRLPDSLLAATEEDVDPDFSPDRTLKDGQTLRQQGGDDRWHLRALHTPGHFPNHMCYALPAQGLLFSGDHVMGWSTTVVVPPLGNLSDYLTSLDRLAGQTWRLMLPSHGPLVEEPGARMAEIRAHRMTRHGQVLDCVRRGCTDPARIVDQIYEGLTPRLERAARGCVIAHLHMAERDGDLAPMDDTANPLATSA
ncbi:MBL fold metallo-hydrolase [Yunchengibacter salinarum]|uniref:MBL fold metallo-hydrolase n=1 Tax=Yunchengibacter salinarum TaxID=3133399 RepID=UPI0035B67BDD